MNLWRCMIHDFSFFINSCIIFLFNSYQISTNKLLNNVRKMMCNFLHGRTKSSQIYVFIEIFDDYLPSWQKKIYKILEKEKEEIFASMFIQVTDALKIMLQIASYRSKLMSKFLRANIMWSSECFFNSSSVDSRKEIFFHDEKCCFVHVSFFSVLGIT